MSVPNGDLIKDHVRKMLTQIRQQHQRGKTVSDVNVRISGGSMEPGGGAAVSRRGMEKIHKRNNEDGSA